VLYDLPLKLLKCCGVSTTCWALSVILLGGFHGSAGLYLAYTVEGVALLGHHAILYGLAQWVLDIFKQAAKVFIRRRLCGGDTDPYVVLATELMEPFHSKALSCFTEELSDL
ncbi:unnamed protein product, partial [Effrenium voratum]